MRGLSEPKNPPAFQIHKRSRRIFGLSREEAIRAFFGGQALVAVVVLALITVFLFREGFGFFAQQRAELTRYRRSGVEFVDLLREQERAHGELGRRLGLRGEVADRFADAIVPLRALLGELGEWALEIKESEESRADGAPTRFGEVAEITAQYPKIEDTFGELTAQLGTITESSPGLSPEQRAQLEKHLSGFGATLAKLRAWDAEKPVSRFSQARCSSRQSRSAWRCRWGSARRFM